MTQHAHTNTPHPYSGTATIPPGLDYKTFGDVHRLMCLKCAKVTGFSSCLALCLPEVAARLEESDFGILHLEVGALRLATRDAIARRDWYNVGRYFSFVADVLESAGAELADAIKISYLGNLLSGEPALNFTKARSLLPRPLLIELAEVERHYETMRPS